MLCNNIFHNTNSIKNFVELWMNDICLRLRFGLVNSINTYFWGFLIEYTIPNVSLNYIYLYIRDLWNSVLLLLDNQLKLFLYVCRKYKMVMSYHNILVNFKFFVLSEINVTNLSLILICICISDIFKNIFSEIILLSKICSKCW